MSDGTLVNPAFFIEFGFGILGEKAPMKDHEKCEWEYNINGHTKGWSYLGRDGDFHGSKGRVGTNFMYNAKQKAKDEVDFAKQNLSCEVEGFEDELNSKINELSEFLKNKIINSTEKL